MHKQIAVIIAFVVLAGIYGAGFRLRADEKAEKKDVQADAAEISFYRDIRPIFQEHCQGCHQPAKRGGEYVMTAFKELLKGGESESPAVVPGESGRKLSAAAHHARRRGQGRDAQGEAGLGRGADREDQDLDQGRREGRHARIRASKSSTRRIRRSISRRR